jgi:very-short-patch-repair endonuclease
MGRPKHTTKAGRYARTNRKEMPWSEARLWSAIRGQATGARFRRQVPIGVWIADFACLNPRIVIEVDGPSHDFTDEALRTEYVESRGFTILRFDNDDIRDNILGVCALIEETVAQLRDGS